MVEGSGLEAVAKIVVDDRVFDRRFVIRSWLPDSLHSPDCAKVCGLNFHGNVLDL